MLARRLPLGLGCLPRGLAVARMAALYGAAKTAYPTTLIAGALLVGMLWGAIDAARLFAWYGSLVVVTLLQPGAGLGFDPAKADVNSVKAYTSAGEHLSTVDFVLNVIPDTIVGGFARGDVLQVLLFSVLFGLALLRLGPRVHRLVEIVEMTSAALFDDCLEPSVSSTRAISFLRSPMSAFSSLTESLLKSWPSS